MNILPTVVGDICASYVGLHEISILNVLSSLQLTSPDIQKHMYPFHPDMKYATTEWIPTVVADMEQQNVSHPVLKVYFFSRWYANEEIETHIRREAGKYLRFGRCRLLASILQPGAQMDVQDIAQLFLNSVSTFKSRESFKKCFQRSNPRTKDINPENTKPEEMESILDEWLATEGLWIG